jgi:multiple sugar transport system ATP-binding protein
MDEPLSNLDAQLRGDTRLEILRLHRRLGTTVVYVTHDQVEAMTMGDRIVVMDGGHLQQVAPPREVYEYPENMFVAGFIGSPAMNFLHGRVETNGAGPAACGAGFRLPLSAGTMSRFDLGKNDIVIGVRPENARDGRIAPEHWPRLRAAVDVVELPGHDALVHVHVGQTPFCARMDIESATLSSGDVIELAIDMTAVHIFDCDTKHTLRRRDA